MIIKITKGLLLWIVAISTIFLLMGIGRMIEEGQIFLLGFCATIVISLLYISLTILTPEEVYELSGTKKVDEFLTSHQRKEYKDDDYEVVTWPDCQELMDLEGFRENSCLINDEPLFSEYGSSAYFVRKKWLSNLGDELTNL